MANFLKPLARVPNHSKFSYEPRYIKKKETNLEVRQNSIKLEKGSFYKHAKTFSKLKGDSITHYNHNTKSRKHSKYIVSLAMMACVSVYYLKGGTAGLFALAGLLILLVIFIRLNNKT